MDQIIKFRVALKGMKSKIWREIELQDTEELDTLICIVLATFKAAFTHLFRLEFKGQGFEFHQNPPSWNDANTIEPDQIKLSQLNLVTGDKMTLIYDFGSEWEFEITAKGFREIDSSTIFSPTIIRGKGQGIIEDIYPFDLKALIDETDETGKPADLNSFWEDDFYDYDEDDEEEDEDIEDDEDEIRDLWDYREFDLELENKRLKYHLSFYKRELKEMYL